jgi:hypothetical protein
VGTGFYTLKDNQKAVALDAALKGMFHALESRPAPEHVLRIVDQLEEAAPEGLRPSPSPSSIPEP